MEIVEYFKSDNKTLLLEQLKKCEWGAGKFLYKLIINDNVYNTLDTNTLIFMLVDNDKLISFCTLSRWDDVQPTELTPWIGFVYTFPEYRGNHYAGKLFKHAEDISVIMGNDYIYISTNLIGYYEKYGYEFLDIRN